MIFCDGAMGAAAMGPPYNLGECVESHQKMIVYSEIWGTDSAGNPKEYEVDVDIAVQGRWASVYIGGCIHPAAPRRNFDRTICNTMNIGESVYTWDDTAIQNPTEWDTDEQTGFPDRIYFKQCLPESLLVVDADASQIPVQLQEIDIENIKTGGYGTAKYTGEKITNGQLLIADTGAMEICGSAVVMAYNETKQSDGSMKKTTMEIYKTMCIDCGTTEVMYTKVGKKRGDPESGFWIGFLPFSFNMYLDDSTWMRESTEQNVSLEDKPTTEDMRSYVTKSGYDLMQRSNDLFKLNKDETVKKRLTINHYKEIFTRYKNYYEHLTEDEKQEILPTLNEVLNTYMTGIPTSIKSSLTLTNYLPATYAAPQ